MCCAGRLQPVATRSPWSGPYGAMTGAKTAAMTKSDDADRPDHRRLVAQQPAERVAPQAAAGAALGDAA